MKATRINYEIRQVVSHGSAAWIQIVWRFGTLERAQEALREIQAQDEEADPVWDRSSAYIHETLRPCGNWN